MVKTSKDALSLIAKMLPPQDRARCMRVSKHWKKPFTMKHTFKKGDVLTNNPGRWEKKRVVTRSTPKSIWTAEHPFVWKRVNLHEGYPDVEWRRNYMVWTMVPTPGIPWCHNKPARTKVRRKVNRWYQKVEYHIVHNAWGSPKRRYADSTTLFRYGSTLTRTRYDY